MRCLQCQTCCVQTSHHSLRAIIYFNGRGLRSSVGRQWIGLNAGRSPVSDLFFDIALSDTRNSVAMLIIGFDRQKNIVKSVKKTGARYLWQIAFDDDRKGVNFIGQSRQSVDATLDELADLDDIQTSTANVSTFPPPPDGWKYFNLLYPNKTLSNKTKYEISNPCTRILYIYWYVGTFSASKHLTNSMFTSLEQDHRQSRNACHWLGCGRKDRLAVQQVWRTMDLENLCRREPDCGHLWGENYDSVQLTLDELISDPNINITTNDRADFPPAPDGWYYCCLPDPEQSQASHDNIPIITFGTNTYTGAYLRLPAPAGVIPANGEHSAQQTRWRLGVIDSRLGRERTCLQERAETWGSLCVANSIRLRLKRCHLHRPESQCSPRHRGRASTARQHALHHH